MTDHWRAYAELLPETLHILSKAEKRTVELFFPSLYEIWK